MDPLILFFLFGIIAGFLKCDLKFNPGISELLTIILLFTIGLKGGVELNSRNFLHLLPQILLVASLGLILPMIAFPILKRFGGLSRVDAASLAAHYGSVSVGTFAVCIAFLNSQNINYEPYVPLFVIILEIPAIILGLAIAKNENKGQQISQILGESFRSRAVVLLIGGLLIGWIAGTARLEPYSPFFMKLFHGALALFLIEMGFIASQQFGVIRKYGRFILAFGMVMPMVSACIALGIALILNLSMGGALVLMVLGASSSYIAVPAAMRVSLPQANLSLSLGSSLGITFPFNILAGIPLYFYVLQFIYGSY